ncbi:IS1096 element passenger TnpR family protein [Novosphingobium resinovorum]|uniref:Plasmid pRiA4b ORF-3 family protein n=1 Tax=Novosphingobium resinovorum TaxID=158500 RepID=A0A031JR13_9SPHN|nr:hypothetical protein [Novosphingobium resinovorum]AOR79426.1 hypothetical protein BES08_21575 [Novosphingobium resinovorum]EZP79365.1 Plasmid pRiA4b ORF-3 family protein [Novosphingobium resinovorum]
MQTGSFILEGLDGQIRNGLGGGIPGFYDMLEIRSGPKHEQYAEINDWLDGYDPEELDILPIEVALGLIIARVGAH